VRHVAAGWTHTAIATEAGSVFTWGCGEHGALGHGSTEDEYTPRKAPCPAPTQHPHLNATIFECKFAQQF